MFARGLYRWKALGRTIVLPALTLLIAALLEINILEFAILADTRVGHWGEEPEILHSGYSFVEFIIASFIAVAFRGVFGTPATLLK